MSELTQGYGVECRESIGGISEVYIIEHGNAAFGTDVAGEIPSVTNGTEKRWWKYELQKQTGSLVETRYEVASSGAVFYSQILSFPIRKLQASTRNELWRLAQNKLCMIVKDRNGKYWLIGRNNGARLQATQGATGTSMGHFNGYTLSFRATEEASMYAVSAVVAGGLEIPGS